MGNKASTSQPKAVEGSVLESKPPDTTVMPSAGGSDKKTTSVKGLTLNRPMLNQKKLKPPSMEGSLWRLNGSANCWVRNKYTLDNGVISSKGGSVQLKEYSMQSFRLVNDLSTVTGVQKQSNAVEAPPTCPMPLPASAFISRLAGERDRIVAAEVESTPSDTAAAVGAAASDGGSISVNLAQLLSVDLTTAGLNGSAHLTPPGCAALFLLSPVPSASTPSGESGDNASDHICLVLDGSQEPLSWLMAMRTHMSHYGDGGGTGGVSPSPFHDSPSPPRSPSPSRTPNPTDVPQRKRGFALKQGRHIIKTWTCRLVVLEEGVLSYYERPLDIFPYGMGKKGEVVLTSFQVRTVGSLPQGAKDAAAKHFQQALHEGGSEQPCTVDSLIDCVVELHSDELKETFFIAFVNEAAVAASGIGAGAGTETVSGSGASSGAANTTGVWRVGSPSLTLQRQISVCTLPWNRAIEAHAEYAKAAGLE